MPKHWFFDFDGTLCDTEQDIKMAWKAAIAALGRSCPQFESVYKTGPTLKQVSYMLFDDCDEALVEDIKKQFAIFYDSSDFVNSKPYPWILPWLEELKKRGASIYIATNKRWSPTDTITRKLGWDKYFDGVFTFDMFAYPCNQTPGEEINGKVLTKAELLSYQMKIRGIDKSDAVMVGDTFGDVSSGQTAGVKTVGVTWGYGEDSEVDSADIILNKGDFDGGVVYPEILQSLESR
jgi:phosphoglycolate phosphatase